MTGILVATDEEARPLVEALSLETAGHLSGFPFWVGRDLVMVRSGMGPAVAEAATRALLRIFSPDRLLLTGVAGGLAPESECGQLVISADSDSRWLEQAVQALPEARVGTVVSRAEVLITSDTKRLLYEETGALAVDMETASAVRVAGGLPWLGLRVIADGPDFSMPLDFNELSTPAGLPDYPAILAGLARRPRALPGMLALARRTARATSVMASAVARLL